ncbi:SGNH/GDSL hydrolase family protein [Ereboglobus luteus]|uniref:SGNH/GDSL hydrolase family protein n=1 Tax=Ereboglobus luteus TaxID=1796921 RepID=UPI001F2561AE|nr:SGNH/GDSL hydrolase family protein [Ereboglobus luteus]
MTHRVSSVIRTLAILIFCMSASINTNAAQPARQGSTIAGFAARAEAREPLTVVFFGGSLTWGANASDPNRTSYRGRMMRWLREKYPRTSFNFHDAAIGGTGSALGLFRLDRDVLAHIPDLVFLDFTVNDGISGADEFNMASYERIVRNLLESGAAVMPVLTCMQAQMIDTDPAQPARTAAHQKLADAYGLHTADIMNHARRAIAEGRADPVKMYPFGRDRTHPDDCGYEIFFEAVRDAFVKAAAAPAPKTAPIPPKTVYPDLYPERTRHVLANTPLPEGWSRVHCYRNAMWFDRLSGRWIGDVARTETNAPLSVAFRGSFVGLVGRAAR